MIISFSGIDSSGKTTQLDIFEQYCKNEGYNVKKIWGKGRGTPGVLLLKEIFRGDKHMTQEEKKEYRKEVYKNSKKRCLLLTASILDLWWYFGLYYRFLNWTHKILICDRYIWDTYIDFLSEFPEYNVDNWIIWKIAVALAPHPKYSFMFYISAEESYRRDQQKGDPDLDPIEIKRAKVDKYMKQINSGKWNVVIDGTNDRQSISEQVRTTVFGK